ncbi:MAG: AAA family ATPase [Erythrobacter sp.]|nr:AAA family ATPase [Erythrobacter sp.]
MRVILINGPLGIGKTTLANSLMERLPDAVHLCGDAFVQANPEPDVEALDDALAAMAEHWIARGYSTLVIEHYWSGQAAIDGLMNRLAAVQTIDDARIFLLELDPKTHDRRIERRQTVRAMDETEFEWRTVAEERRVLATGGESLGEPFDVSAPVDELVRELLKSLNSKPGD